MNRLESELQRLYRLPSTAAPGDVRALVLELGRPADWEALSRVWRGVQADLALPAPAIAVSGSDGLQLWFSLQAPVNAARGAEFLAGLRARYLADIAPARLRLTPPAAELPPVPAEQPATGNWSAFVAPDLAAVFVDTPWLDIPPGAEGQADLLARLESIRPAAFDAAMQGLQPGDAAAAMPPATLAPASGDTPDVDPRRFLQRVLNDETVTLALRIEAAKALLARS
ncbi:hypothetical protein ACG04R_03290 [Roseateles sp. BYS78W]|uniref:DUF721 domain-containing protein n=1 Tax=Pelomonas candidula TaxID=3299025 RepID=A0ABW7H780_9BURK